MKNTIYLNAKELIKSEAKILKRQNPKDKPYIRQFLNDLCNDLISQFNFHAMKETISEKQAKMYTNWLSNYTADQHPK
jgi:bifunctional DNase/RNase